jgi:hypothetical protein
LAVLNPINELSDGIKDRKFLDQVGDNQKSSSLWGFGYGYEKNFGINFHISVYS